MGDGAEPIERTARNKWWEFRSTVLGLTLFSAAPLLWPKIPPLVDLPGHLGRYRVQLDLATSPELQRFYEFKWAIMGNLGVDLLVMPLAPILGLEASVKLIVLAIPILTVAGIVFVSREVHGRIPPTVMFAIPFVYGYPFNFGFLNFSLSMGLALLLFGLWLCLERLGRPWARGIIFVPLSSLLWLTHVFGWGVLGLLAFSATLVSKREAGISWAKSVVRAIPQILPLCTPIILMVAWRSGAQGETWGYNPLWKVHALLSAIRDQWLVWDSLSVAAILILLYTAVSDRRFEIAGRLRVPATILAITFLALPYGVMGSAYADMRLAPYVFVIALIAIRVRPTNERLEEKLAFWGITFCSMRLLGNTISFSLADADLQERLQALDSIPYGAAVLSLTPADCRDDWKLPRYWHLGGFVIARKHGFSNDQWQLPGAQLLRVKYREAYPYIDETTAWLLPASCLGSHSSSESPTDAALNKFPRHAFDYVWLIRPPDFDFGTRPGLTIAWRGEDSILYRVNHEQSRHQDRLRRNLDLRSSNRR